MKLLNKYSRMVFLGGAAILLETACAAPGEGSTNRMPTDAEVEQYNATVDPSEHIVCRNERPVGSHIPVRVCRRVADMETISTHHREELRRVLR